MFFKKILKRIKSFPLRLSIKSRQKKYKGRLSYLFYDNSSDSIIIVFSGFTGKTPKYNYVKSLGSLPIDRLYILDDFGYMGSYYWFENGEETPRRLTEDLINNILSKNYKHVFFAGSSKGGTCSIFYGLQYNAELIFSGACQFNVGSYLHRKDHENIFYGMMGKHAGEEEACILNSMMPKQFEKYAGSSSLIHLVYSKNELTYQRQIIDLLQKGHKCNLQIIEHLEDFSNHEDIGVVFPSWVIKLLVEHDSICKSSYKHHHSLC